MENDEQQGGPDRLVGADTAAKDNKAEVRDRRVSEHFLSVAGADGSERTDEERRRSHQRNHEPNRGAGHYRREAHNEVNARLHHRAGMQQRGNRSRRHHRPEQPARKRQLRGFRDARETQQRRRHQHQRLFGTNQRLQLDGLDALVTPDDGQRERQSAGQVHDQRPPCVAQCLIRLRVADQQERAQGGDFPKQEQPGQVVGENQAEHRSHEDEQQRKEQRPPVLHLRVGDFMVLPHVTHGIDADTAAHQTIDQRHDH